MIQRNDFYTPGSVEVRLLQTLVDEALRALHEMSPVHWLFIAAGGHWAVWMRSAAEPEFVIKFAVGNEANPHGADTEEPEFIAYLQAPQSTIAASILSLLASFGNIASPFVGGEVEWTLVGSLEGSMDIAGTVLNVYADRVAILRQQMIEDLPRTMGASVDHVLRYVRLHALPYAGLLPFLRPDVIFVNGKKSGALAFKKLLVTLDASSTVIEEYRSVRLVRDREDSAVWCV